MSNHQVTITSVLIILILELATITISSLQTSFMLLSIATAVTGFIYYATGRFTLWLTENNKSYFKIKSLF